MSLHSDKIQLQQQIQTQETECQRHKSLLENVEKKVDDIMNEMQKMETRNNRNKYGCPVLDTLSCEVVRRFVDWPYVL